jgi:hypothetical protein
MQSRIPCQSQQDPQDYSVTAALWEYSRTHIPETFEDEHANRVAKLHALMIALLGSAPGFRDREALADEAQYYFEMVLSIVCGPGWRTGWWLRLPRERRNRS